MPKTIKKVFSINKNTGNWLNGMHEKEVYATDSDSNIIYGSERVVYSPKPNYVKNLPKQESQHIEITIEKKPTSPIIIPDYEIEIGNLSFDVEQIEIKNFCEKLIEILRDPTLVGQFLKPLNDELETELKKNNIEFEDEDPYQYLITGSGYFLPGPPREDYMLYHKHKILDQILLKHEQVDKVNLNGVGSFIGAVESQTADKYVSEGNIYKEDVQISTAIIHGKNTHRLQFEIIRQALAAGFIKLEVTDKETKQKRNITPKELLELFINVKIKKPGAKYSITQNLWNLLIDNFMDSTIDGSIAKQDNKHFDPENYSYSSRSPYVFNSLLLCFGKEIGLKTLQHYLLDSHYKEMLQMIKNGEKDELEKASDQAYYDYYMLQLSQGRDGSFMTKLDTEFNFTDDDRIRQSHYNKVISGKIGYKEDKKTETKSEDSPAKKPRILRETREEYKARKLQEKNKPIKTQ